MRLDSVGYTFYIWNHLYIIQQAMCYVQSACIAIHPNSPKRLWTFFKLRTAEQKQIKSFLSFQHPHGVMLHFSETLLLHLTNASRQRFSKEKMRAKRHFERQRVTALRHFKPTFSTANGREQRGSSLCPGMVYICGIF